MIGIFLFLAFILCLIAALPIWPHSRSWGYYPTGGIGVMLVLLAVSLLSGWI